MTTEEIERIEIDTHLACIHSDDSKDAVIGNVFRLIAEVRRLQCENEKLTYYSSAGKMLLDMAESWYQDDGLPRENKLDDAINAWLRMRAARDEEIADKEREYARGRADAVESIVKLIQATGGRLDRLDFPLEATDD